MSETVPKRILNDAQQEYINSFGLMDQVRYTAKFTRSVLRTSVMHPSFLFVSPAIVFGVADPEKVAAREKRNDELVLGLNRKMTEFVVRKELGSDAYRFETACMLFEAAAPIVERAIADTQSRAATTLASLPILNE